MDPPSTGLNLLMFEDVMEVYMRHLAELSSPGLIWLNLSRPLKATIFKDRREQHFGQAQIHVNTGKEL